MIFLVIAVLCIPLMLLPKPFIMRRQQEERARRQSSAFQMRSHMVHSKNSSQDEE
jgi:hypothetical protein